MWFFLANAPLGQFVSLLPDPWRIPPHQNSMTFCSCLLGRTL